MNSDVKTLIPSLIQHVNSDLFTFDNVSSSISIATTDRNDIRGNVPLKTWSAVINYLPLRFHHIIESWPDMYTIEDFDIKYACNPKLCAFERYELTNMWRPLMILNNCPTISRFDFEFIRYYNMETFSNLLSTLISRVQRNE